MDSVLGTVEAMPINIPHHGVQQNALASDSTRILERLVRKVESWDSKTTATANSQSNETALKGQKYDDYDRAAIKGFAGIINDREIPCFYSLAQTISIDRVDTHSLRGGGANALSLAGYSDCQIQKMGRRRGETFKEYISEYLSEFSAGMSKSMMKTFGFVHVAGGVFQDITNIAIATEYSINNSTAPATAA
jgi:hypothetical protein